MKKVRLLLWVLCLCGLLSAGGSAEPRKERVLVRAAKPYDSLVANIQAMGGTVTYQFKNFNLLAAEIPADRLAALRALAGQDAVSKDNEVQGPAPVDVTRGKGGLVAIGDEQNEAYEDVSVLGAEEIAEAATAAPNAYLLNNANLNVTPLLGAGFTGQGVVVGVIDSGIRPGFPHITLDGSVIGCEDFVGDALGCSNFGNNGHGTFVAGMISANVNFTFGATSAIRLGAVAVCPSCFSNPPTNTQIPMIGSAPLSSIYAFRVFGATGGAPTARILAAFDRAVTLKRNFDNGVAGGVNIRVINMSLGGSTIYPGRDAFDAAMQAALDANIVLVISAGNAGPSSLTVGSPGTSYPAITVGASSDYVHEQILRRLQFGQTTGSRYRPFTGTQMSYFSSRGPNADGNLDPDVVANGFGCYGQGTGSTTGTISLGSGTSFSSPTVAGVAALLRQAFPSATARQVRNAIIMSANPSRLNDGSTPIDQGAGYVDALAAYNLLNSGTVPDVLPTGPSSNKNVKVNIEQATWLQTQTDNVQQSFSNLLPGQRHDILYRVTPNTKQVIITLSNVTPELPAAQQNLLFGDDVLLAVHSSKTSAIGEGDYKVFSFTSGGTFVVNDPELGIMRITANGDWTNAGRISGDITIVSLKEALPQFSTQGKVVQSDLLAFPVNVPAGVTSADFRLEWREDWGSYPSNDVDMFLVRPDGTVSSAGATSNNPERVVVANPAAGTWMVLVSGFEVNSGWDKYELRVALDGKVVKIK